MNLLKVFLELSIPNGNDSKSINAITLTECPIAKVGINDEGFAVVLISTKEDGAYLSRKNVKLKYLELTHNLVCRVTEVGKSSVENLSIITFKSKQSELLSYFFGISESLLESLSKSPTQREISEIFENYAEIFRYLSETPSKTLQGLWAELFLIERSSEQSILLNYWHLIPEERFDFNADSEKVEVKSSSNMERTHIFSAEQLMPSADKQVIIASLFLRQVTNGRSLIDLMDSIKANINENSLTEKMYNIVAKTLGNVVEQSIGIKYDYELAKNSLQFYRHQDISKIERISIPERVSDVKYKSDLTNVAPIIPSTMPSRSKLFESL